MCMLYAAYQQQRGTFAVDRSRGGAAMAGRMDGKVSFITGAGRGQGRAHAVKQASEGADIIAIDICEDIESNPYPMSSWEDLQETKTLVERHGRRCVAVKADVRP